MAKKTITIATREITGGTKSGGRHKLKAQEELTAAEKKALGLTNDDVDALIAKGALIEVPAHVAETGGGPSAADLKAANDRAAKAEGDLAEANSKLAKLDEEHKSLTAQLEAAKTAAAKS